MLLLVQLQNRIYKSSTAVDQLARKIKNSWESREMLYEMSDNGKTNC